MMKTDQQKSVITFPRNILEPIKRFLEEEVVKWKRAEKKIKKNDPFADDTRTVGNSLENDTDEQIGRFEAEVKADFVKKHLVQLRKALTKIKLGRYGLCDKCGKMIDTERLAIKPEITTCINCARDQE